MRALTRLFAAVVTSGFTARSPLPSSQRMPESTDASINKGGFASVVKHRFVACSPLSSIQRVPESTDASIN